MTHGTGQVRHGAVVPAEPRPALLTDDPARILRFAAESHESGLPTVLVTLTEIRGGAARAPGAQMAVRADGLYCGLVSGGCVEPAVAVEALAAMRDGADRVVRFGAGSGIFDIVLPCGGGITLALHQLRDPQPLRAVLARLAERHPAALRYCPATQTLTAAGPAAAEFSAAGGFLRPYRPGLRLFLAGAGPEATVLARLARAAEYEVSAAACDADTAAIFLHHDLDREIPGLVAALASDAFYIGALGSARTHATRLARLGVAESAIARIKAPIGLFGPSRDATTLAISVLAEIGKVRQDQCVG